MVELECQMFYDDYYVDDDDYVSNNSRVIGWWGEFTFNN